MVKNRPGATGGILGPCPPKSLLVPPQTRIVPSSDDCASKKFIGSVLLEYNSRPETSKIQDVIPEFVSKNRCFVDFAINSVCFGGFTPEFMKIRVCLGTKTYFFLWVFISEFVEICLKHLFRVVHTHEFK